MRGIAPWALVALSLPALAAGQPAPAARTKVAVLDLRPISVDKSLAELLSEVALTETASLPYLDVIGRSDIQAMLGFEKQKKILGCEEDSACIAEIGGALGVKYVLVGSVGKIGTLYRIDVKAIDTGKAGQVRRRGVNVEGAEEKMVAAVQGAVRDLFKAEAEVAGAPAAAAPVAATAPAAAPPPEPVASEPAPYVRERRWYAGLRLAYAGAGGDYAQGIGQSELIGGQGVFQLDLSYRITDRLRLGGYYSYGNGKPGKKLEAPCDLNATTCSLAVTRVGLSLSYEFASQTDVLVPFVGVGTGFEALDVKYDGEAASFSGKASGWEPINLEAGLDFRLGIARFGPYVAAGVARYGSADVDLTDLGAGSSTVQLDSGTHSYAYFGVRAALEL